MCKDHIRSITVVAAVLVAVVLPTGCGTVAQPQCTGGLQPYQGKCLSNATIEYLGCTDGRGINILTETGGSIGGSFKAVADASLEVAHRKVQQENTPVALEIVRTCLELVKSTGQATEAEQASAVHYQEQIDQSLEQWQQKQVAETPGLSLSRPSGRPGNQLTVTGQHFIPGEPVDLSINFSLLTQITASPDGSFSTTVTVPQLDVKPINYYVIAQGVTSSRSAKLPFQLVE